MPQVDPSLEEDLAPLYSFQERVVSFICGGKQGVIPASDLQKIRVAAAYPGRAILDIDPGLGKSRIALEVYKKLCFGEKLLIPCSKKALNTWRREVPKWCPYGLKVAIVEGPPTRRQAMWRTDADVYVVTYQSGMNDLEYISKHYFRMAIADECKLFTSRKTKAFKFWKPILTNIHYLILMDGTLVKEGPQDLWTFLNILKPETFGSYWRFVGAFCNVVDTQFGKDIAGPKNTKGLANMLAPRVMRIREKDVEGQRPPLTRDFKLVDMTKKQSSFYWDLVDNLVALTPNGTLIAAPSQLALSIRLRQTLACPMIHDETMGYGAAIDHLLLEMDDDPHVVIYTPFAMAVPYIAKAIIDKGHPAPYILKGGVTSRGIQEVEEGFNAERGRERATICTIKFAESFELYTAKQAFFIGYEWSQRENYQAEKRLHRLITPHPINIWYYRYVGTADDHVLERLNDKQRSVNMTFQDYIAAVKKSREEMLT